MDASDIGLLSRESQVLEVVHVGNVLWGIQWLNGQPGEGVEPLLCTFFSLADFILPVLCFSTDLLNDPAVP